MRFACAELSAPFAHTPRLEQIRIAVLSDAILSRNGVGTYYRDLSQHLRGNVAAVDIIAPTATGDNRFHGPSVTMPGDPTQRMYIPHIREVLRQIRGAAPHLLVVPTPGPFGLMGGYLARRLQIPMIAGYHTAYDRLVDLYWQGRMGRSLSTCVRYWNNAFFRAAAVTVANSPAFAEAARAAGARQVRLVGTTVAETFLAPQTRPCSGQLNSVLFAGRLSEEKNVPDIIEAAAACPDIRFCIAGDGPLRSRVARAARDLPNLTYAGWVKPAALRDLMDHSDLFLLPSREEAFGTVALEAMTRGRLVLVSERCGILDWPLLAGGLLTFTPNTPLSRTLNDLRQMPEARQKAIAAKAFCRSRQFHAQTLQHWLDLCTRAVRFAGFSR